ncbi:MAG: ribosomal L7Ae/L30e/S12e/Gadd45 family protein [Ruminococcus sp.]|nr:ribosomal L7Ae/L30e/S12e/Gadd45 family protein [Ruminococcus sp.]
MHCSMKWISLLTICRKAGRLVMGFDPSKEEIQAGRAKGVFVTKDASEKTKKEMRFFCSGAGVPLREIAVSMYEIQQAVGRKAGVLAICDAGFAGRLMELAEEMLPDTVLQQDDCVHIDAKNND